MAVFGVPPDGFLEINATTQPQRRGRPVCLPWLGGIRASSSRGRHTGLPLRCGCAIFSKTIRLISELTELQSISLGGKMLFCSYLGLVAALALLGMIHAAPSNEEDEQILRRMADEALNRLNKGDLTVFEDFWAQDADYVSVQGKLITGRAQIQAFFRELI